MNAIVNAIAAPAANVAAAAPKKARTVRTAQKTVAKKESAVTKTAKVIGLQYVITGARPTAGRHLYAFTAAVLHVTGMDKGAAVDRAILVDVMGSRAVQYHLADTCAFAVGQNGIELNGDYGRDRLYNAKRAYDPKDFDAYVAMLQTGKADDRLVKNQGMIRAVKPA